MSRNDELSDRSIEAVGDGPIIVDGPRERPSSISAGVIRVGAAKEIPSVLREFGLDPDRTVALAGVDPRLLDDPDNVIPFTTLGHLIAVCVGRPGRRRRRPPRGRAPPGRPIGAWWCATGSPAIRGPATMRGHLRKDAS